jgi:hypothetical protein
MAAGRLVQRQEHGETTAQRAAMLTALTSFEFFDALAESCGSEAEATGMVLSLVQSALAG